jgi:hypothetical protein
MNSLVRDRRVRSHEACGCDQALRGDPPRRDLPALCGSRRDLQPRLPGLAHPLPGRSSADDQNQRARGDQQHAGPGEAHFNHWFLLYDDLRRRPTPELIGTLCVVALQDAGFSSSSCSKAELRESST